MILRDAKVVWLTELQKYGEFSLPGTQDRGANNLTLHLEICYIEIRNSERSKNPGKTTFDSLLSILVTTIDFQCNDYLIA